jgi:hypothetical protein
MDAISDSHNIRPSSSLLQLAPHGGNEDIAGSGAMEELYLIPETMGADDHTPDSVRGNDDLSGLFAG